MPKRKVKFKKKERMEDLYPFHSNPVTQIEEWDNIMSTYYEYCAD